MTRAKQRLFLTWAAERSLYGGTPQSTLPSRFLQEIDRAAVQERKPKVRTAANPWRNGPSHRGGSRPMAAVPDGAANSFLPGERVVHRKWGEGVVVSARGSGNDREVTVDFVAGDRRSLLLVYANLERAEG